MMTPFSLRTTSTFVALLSFLGVVLIASSAHGSSAALSPTARDQLLTSLGPDPGAADTILDTLVRVMEGHGWTVFDPSEGTALPEELENCRMGSPCAWRLRRQLDVDLLVGVVVTGDEGANAVRVTVLGEQGIGYVSAAPVDRELQENAYLFATADAVRGALSRWSGASLAAAVPQADPVVVSAGPADEGEEREERTEPSPLNWWLGGLLLAGSAPGLGYAINTLAREGDCVQPLPEGQCGGRVRFREGAAIFGSVGLAFLAGGLTILIAQPFRMRASVSTEHAGLVAEGRF